MRWLCLLAVLAAMGCKKNDKSDDGAGRAEPPPAQPDTPAADAAAKPKPAKPTMLNKMKHCPSAVPDAHTTIEKGDGAVSAIVIGKDKPGVDAIRERAARVAEMEPRQVTDPVHDGTGSGGALGKCPARAPNSKAEVAEIDNGVKLTFTPVNPEDLDGIVEMLRARAKELNDRRGRPHGSGGGRRGGGGHGGHGSTGQGGN